MFDYFIEKKFYGDTKRLARSINKLVKRGQRQARLCFICGVQRSGTTMVLELLNRSFDTEVFFEGDTRAYKQFGLRADNVIQELVENSSAKVMVIKNFTRAHLTREMLDSFFGARACWIFRNYESVILSNLRRFDQKRNYLDEIVQDRNAGVWRARGMTDETYHKIKSVYRPSINNESAQAIFWYYRNQLMFDQGLEEDNRVLVFDYDDLLASTRERLVSLCGHIGIRCNSHMVRHVRVPSAAPIKSLPIDAEVRAICDEMYARLRAAFVASSTAIQ